MRSRRTYQFLFYFDIVLLGLGAVALVTLVHDAFAAGYHSNVDPSLYGSYLARIAVESAVLVLALVYFLARFYKVRIKELANPWG